ncbi:MAG: sulfatase/phosphatase domain-containing protein, partial [Planctomycetaceae bacterium]
AFLESTGELDNTVIVYTADQGFMLGEHDYIDKRWMYEESLRMPFVIRFPEQIRAGSVVDDLINNVDFAPTLLELAGVSADDFPQEFQGRSFVANLAGSTPDDWRTSSYYRYWMHMAHHDNPAHYGIRTHEHKLIFFYGLPLHAPGAQKIPVEPHWELYDLIRDPHEMTNVFADPNYVEIRRQLTAELLRVKKEIGDEDDSFPELIERFRSSQ